MGNASVAQSLAGLLYQSASALSFALQAVADHHMGITIVAAKVSARDVFLIDGFISFVPGFSSGSRKSGKPMIRGMRLPVTGSTNTMFLILGSCSQTVSQIGSACRVPVGT